MIASLIFKDILCHWGAVCKLVTDNGPAFIQALDVLVSQYGIRHIWISPYNSQVNGVVDQRHYNVWEAIVKSTLGGEIRWSATACQLQKHQEDIVTVQGAPTSFSPLSPVDCTLLSHFSFNDFVAIAFWT